jgi:serine/threonine-protein kinase RsbW
LADEIIVLIPASTAHIGLVRATASALAARLDLSYDRIMDLHIAIDEVCSRIRATSNPAPSRLEVKFQVEGNALTVSARGDTKLKEGGAFLSPWSATILESVTDGTELDDDEGVVRMTFRVGRGVSA